MRPIFFTRNLIKDKRKKAVTIALFLSISAFWLLSLFTFPLVSRAQFNSQVNYQAKLTDSSGVAVSDGDYNVEFKLYTVSSGGSAIWTETRCYGASCDGTGTDNREEISGGIFSSMLGEVATLSGVDWNQDLYLGVNIGGSGATASWDGEMTPRKPLGAVPAAFVAGTLDGVDSTQFLRADEADTINATDNSNPLLTIDQGGTAGVVALERSSSGEFISFSDGTNSHAIYNGSGSPESSQTANKGSLYFDATNGSVYIKESGTGNTGWNQIATGVSTLDDAYDNIGAAAAKITIDANESQTGGLEFENQTADNIAFDLQSTGDLVIQDAGSIFATFTDAGQFILDTLQFDGNTIGLTTDTDLISLADGVLTVNGSLVADGPAADGVLELSNSNGGIEMYVLSATPEGSQSGSVGDIVFDETNGILYVKETGTDTNTGWSALESASSNVWQSDGTSVTLADDTQNVGIGVATPEYKLDVDGQIRGETLIGGAAVLSGGNQIQGQNGFANSVEVERISIDDELILDDKNNLASINKAITGALSSVTGRGSLYSTPDYSYNYVGTNISNSSFWMISEDFNGDAILDIGIFSYWDLTDEIWFGAGDGTFANPTTITTTTDSQFAAVGDFNNDGWEDIIQTATLPSNDRQIQIYENDGAAASFTDSEVYDSGSTAPKGIDVGDFNNDGLEDFAANIGSSVYVFINEGDANFATPATYSITNNGSDVKITDTDGDGYDDIVSVQYSQQKVVILENDGDGTFGSPVTYSTSSTPQFIQVADFDNDNIVDITVSGGTKVELFTNDGDGTFTSASNVTIGTDSYTHSVEDMDKDGWFDIVVTSDDYISTLYNDQDGTFTLEQSSYTNGTVLASGDYNRDGVPDIAVADSSDDEFDVFLNDPKIILSTNVLNQSVGVGTDSAAGKFEVEVSDGYNAPAIVVDVDDITNNTDGIVIENAGTGTAIVINNQAAGQLLKFNDQTDTFGIYNNAGTPEGVLAADVGSVAIDTTNGSLYVKTTDTLNTGWSQLAEGGAVSLDVAYNNVGANPAIITLDASEGQTGGFEIENQTTDNITFDLQSTGSFVIQDAGSTFATFDDAGKFVLDNLEFDGNNIGTSADTDLLNLGNSFLTINGLASVENILNVGNSSLTEASDLLNIQNENGNVVFGISDGTPEGVLAGHPGDLTFDVTNGAMYIKETGSDTNTGWVAVATDASGGSDSIDDSYDNFGASAAKITIDANESQTGGLEFENQTADDMAFDLQSTGDLVIQDAGSIFATFTDAGQFILDTLQFDGNTIGLTTDTDLISLANDAVTVNGTLTTEGSASIDSNAVNTTSILSLANSAGNIGVFRVDATPESSVTGSIGDIAIDSTNGLMYIKETGTSTNTGWSQVGAAATTTLDDAYDNIGSGNAAKITVDSSEGQNTGFEIENSTAGSIVFDLQSTGAFEIQDAGSTFAEFTDTGEFTIDSLYFDASSIGTDTDTDLLTFSDENLELSGSLTQVPNAGNMSTVGQLTTGSTPISIRVQNNYAYVVDSTTDSIKTFHVEDLNASGALATLSYGSGVNPNKVWVMGDYAYFLSSGDDRVRAIDISKPGVLTEVGSLYISGANQSITGSGNYLYIVDSQTDILRVIDVSNPSSMSQIASISTGTYAPVNVKVSEGFVYIVDATSDVLRTFDVRDPANPSYMSQASTGTSPKDLVVQGEYVYVVDSTGSLKIYDVSKAGYPILKDTLTGLGAPYSLDVAGNYAYVMNSSNGELKIVDVSDQTDLTLIDTFDYTATSATVRNIQVSNGYAYITDDTLNKVSIIDLGISEFANAEIGNLIAGKLTVQERLDLGGSLSVRGAVNVGSGGLFSSGQIGVYTEVDDYVAKFVNDGAADTNKGILIQAGKDTNPGTGADFIKFQDGNGTVLGAVEGNGSGGVTTASAGADYAEYFYTNDIDLESGEVVCIDQSESNAVERCSVGASQLVAGFISTAPAFLGNAVAEYRESENYVQVAMLGQIPARVSIENGPIIPGDELTSSSTPGIAMRADSDDPTVGVALESFDGSDPEITQIQVMISRKNQSLTITEIEAQIAENVDSLGLTDDIQLVVQDSLLALDLSSDIEDSVLATLADLDIEGQISNSITDAFDSFLDVQENLTFNLGSTGSFVLQQGSVALATFETHEKLIVNDEGEEEMKEIQRMVIDGQSVFKGKITVKANAVFKKNIKVKGHVIFDKDTLGRAVILPGHDHVIVSFEKEYKQQPIVTLTPGILFEGSYAVGSTSTTGFRVSIDDPQEEEVVFNWHAFAAGGDTKITISDGEEEDMEISIFDLEPPTVVLLGEEEIEIDFSEEFNDPGATAIDSIDGDVSESILVSGEITINIPGTYELLYRAYDEEGNASQPVVRLVTVLEDENDDSNQDEEDDDESDNNDSDNDDEEDGPGNSSGGGNGNGNNGNGNGNGGSNNDDDDNEEEDPSLGLEDETDDEGFDSDFSGDEPEVEEGDSDQETSLGAEDDSDEEGDESSSESSDEDETVDEEDESEEDPEPLAPSDVEEDPEPLAPSDVEEEPVESTDSTTE